MTRLIKANPPGTALARFAQALVMFRNDRQAAIKETMAHFPDSPGVYLTIKNEAAAMDSSAALAEYGIGQELYELFLSTSLVGKLADRMRKTPFNIKVPMQTDDGADYAWLGENTPNPIRNFTFDQISLDAFKCGGVVIVSSELARFGNPAAEATIRDLMISGLSAFVDAEFLSANAAIPSTAPAGILGGQQTQVSSGSSEAQIRSDLGSMLGKLQTWRFPIWACKPNTYGKLCSFSGLISYVNGQPMLLGFPIFYSAASPSQLALIDIGSILLADDGKSNIELSNQATITMDDGVSPYSTTSVSLWQSNLVGLRVERVISWSLPGTSSAVKMTVSY